MLNFNTEKCETFDECVELALKIQSALNDAATSKQVSADDISWMNHTLAEYDDECFTGAIDIEYYDD
jgi:hypothetical protein